MPFPTGEVHERLAFAGLGERLEGSDHAGDFRTGLHLVGKAVQQGLQLLRIVVHDLADGHQAHDVVQVGLCRLFLVRIELFDDLVEILLGGFLVLAELGHLGAVVGHELLHPGVVSRIMGLGALLIRRDGGAGHRVHGDLGAVGDEGDGHVVGLDIGHVAEVRRDDDLETAVRHGDGGVDGLAEDDPHGFRGVFGELADDLGGLAGLRGAGGHGERGGQERQVEFHICLGLE